jgi:endoglucanase
MRTNHLLFTRFSRLTITGILIVLGFSSCIRQSESADGTYRGFHDFDIKRGVNISHWLSQSGRRGDQREAFFTRDDVVQIAGFGYDHIRLPIDEEQMWDEQGNKETRAFELLHEAIGWALELELRLIVDLHIIRSHHFNVPENPLWTDRAEQLKFVDMWRNLSEELKDYPLDMVAYELMNEAVADDPCDWNRLVAETMEAVRELEPGRKIVIGSNRWQSVHTFPDLVIPENDPHIILSFHFYDPFLLTHHQASWTHIRDYAGPVNYPGLSVDPADLEGLPEDLVTAVGIHNQVYTRESIEEMIMLPLQYAMEKGLPLYCGEWGCLPSVPGEMRLQWYADVRKVLEKHDIAWANWDYKGGFGVVDRQNGEPYHDLLEVLLK